MSELKHFVSQEVAEALRRISVTTDPTPADLAIVEAAGVFLPIERGSIASGRARCRLCGGGIPVGMPIVRFGWDVYRAERGGFGQLQTAYLHVVCPNPEPERSPE